MISIRSSALSQARANLIALAQPLICHLLTENIGAYWLRISMFTQQPSNSAKMVALYSVSRIIKSDMLSLDILFYPYSIYYAGIYKPLVYGYLTPPSFPLETEKENGKQRIALALVYTRA